MSKLERWKFLTPLVVLMFVFGVMVTGAWADSTKITVTGNPGLLPIPNDSTATAIEVSTNGYVPAGGTAADPNGIIITENAPGDLTIGSTIKITAPAGTKFSSAVGELPLYSCNIVASDLAATTLTLDAGQAGAATVAANYNADSTILTFTVGATSAEKDYIDISNIFLLPTDDSKNNDVNTPDLTFSVQVQVAGKTYTVGAVDLLARPRIVSAVKVSNTMSPSTYQFQILLLRQQPITLLILVAE